MAKYTVNVRDLSGSMTTRTVDAVNSASARESIEADPSVVRVSGWPEEVKDSSNSSSVYSGGFFSSSSNSSDSSSITGNLLLLGGLGAFVAAAATMPWSTMLGLGWMGTKLAERVCGGDFKELVEDNRNRAAVFVLLFALASGGFGFVKGLEGKQYFQEEMNSTSRIEHVEVKQNEIV